VASLVDQVRPVFRRLAPPGSRVVVAVSGGPDSQALLDLAGRVKEPLGWAEMWACGVDHGLRQGCREELELACQLAREHHVCLEVIGVEVARRGNILEQARRARYSALHAFADRVGADRIALGHTATDQVENVLLNLARGTGLRGVRGMLGQRSRLIRPLLEVDRATLINYLSERRISYASDPSNEDPRRARATLRAHVLPALRKLNPEVEASFARFTRQTRRDESFISGRARDELHRRLGALDSLDLHDFATLPTALSSRLLIDWLALHNLRANQRRLLALDVACRSDRVAASVGGVSIYSDAGRLWCARRYSYCLRFPVPGHIRVGAVRATLTSRVLEPCGADALADPQIAQMARGSATTVAFDAERLHLELEVRSWKEGDRLEPFGLGGHTKVGDLFTNEKIPRALRNVWPLVVHGKDVLWVVGLRRGNAAPVAPGSRRVIGLQVGGHFAGHVLSYELVSAPRGAAP
jgi:tRNA(Ile)-lysidine synthase